MAVSVLVTVVPIRGAHAYDFYTGARHLHAPIRLITQAAHSLQTVAQPLSCFHAFVMVRLRRYPHPPDAQPLAGPPVRRRIWRRKTVDPQAHCLAEGRDEGHGGSHATRTAHAHERVFMTWVRGVATPQPHSLIHASRDWCWCWWPAPPRASYATRTLENRPAMPPTSHKAWIAPTR